MVKTHGFAILGSHVKFFNVSKIQFGKYLKLGDHVYISALGKNGVTFGDNVGIGAYSRVVLSTTFDHTGEFVKIGNNVGIGEFAYLGWSRWFDYW
jgi:acetyltransferase-like isoleucine patch superfamily enzyme